jgi:hypothetical protein
MSAVAAATGQLDGDAVGQQADQVLLASDLDVEAGLGGVPDGLRLVGLRESGGGGWSRCR